MGSATDAFAVGNAVSDFRSKVAQSKSARGTRAGLTPPPPKPPKNIVSDVAGKVLEYGGAAVGGLYGGPGGALAGRSAGKALSGGVNQAGQGDVIGGAANVAKGVIRSSSIVTAGVDDIEGPGKGILPTTSAFAPSRLTPQQFIQPKGTFEQAASAGAALSGPVAGAASSAPAVGGAAEVAVAGGATQLLEQLGGLGQRAAGGTSVSLPTSVGQGTKLDQSEVAELIAILSA